MTTETKPVKRFMDGIPPQMAAAIGPQTVPGFRPKPRTRVVVCNTVEADEDAEPFTAEVVISLTNAETQAIRYGTGMPLREALADVSPHIVGWNALARNVETDEWEPLPPPAEGGPEVFMMLDHDLWEWLIVQVKFARLFNPDLPKGESNSSGGPEPANDGASSSSPTKNSTPGTTKKSARSTKSQMAMT